MRNGEYLDNAEYEPCPGYSKCETNNGLVLREGSWRCTSSHEYIFMITKGMGYYCDAEAVKIASVGDQPSGNGFRRPEGVSFQNSDGADKASDQPWQVTARINRRSFWPDITSEPYGGNHQATFPSDLPRTCIQARPCSRRF